MCLMHTANRHTSDCTKPTEASLIRAAQHLECISRTFRHFGASIIYSLVTSMCSSSPPFLLELRFLMLLVRIFASVLTLEPVQKN